MEFDGYHFWFTLNQLFKIKFLLLQNQSDLDGFIDNYADEAPATVIECLKDKSKDTAKLICSVIDAINCLEGIQKAEIDNIDEENLPYE